MLADVKAQLLSDKSDCTVFRVKHVENLNHKDSPVNQADEVVKIVRKEIKKGQDRKPMDLLAHEVDMFELVKKHQTGDNVIKVHEAHVFDETIYMRMEMGEFDMEHKLKDMKKKWKEIKPKHRDAMLADIYKMIEDMATVLADFNRYAIHFALKTDNWVYVKAKDENGHERLKLKLIDLQTAATTVGGKVQNPVKQSSFFYKARKVEPQVKTHASPEHVAFCEILKKEEDSKTGKTAPQHNLPQHASMPELTSKSDIWAMGIVICEILAHTPNFKDFDYEILKAVFVPVKATTAEGAAKCAIKEKLQKAEKELNTHFPYISKLLKKIFQMNPEERPSPRAIKHFVKYIHSKDVDNKENQLNFILDHDEIQQVQREKHRFLKWEVSGVKKDYCKFCFFIQNNTKSGQNAAVIQAGGMANSNGQDTTGKKTDIAHSIGINSRTQDASVMNFP